MGPSGTIKKTATSSSAVSRYGSDTILATFPASARDVVAPVPRSNDPGSTPENTECTGHGLTTLVLTCKTSKVTEEWLEVTVLDAASGGETYW